ncbi:carbon-nitrogen hydrolase family protein [Rhizobium sp. Root1204]|uniref:carbon-nitrogen hydrolase family protein n=1 Tax=Rhizobium sp. Root1204 TaxID=1736428 RepID=UPI0007127760|nr:carbon-nitrogen hydrolase family protein [Rhizobium sp. Root1204]KQV37001.1 amidohydrolase [Rhizobium sp. Root1204]
MRKIKAAAVQAAPVYMNLSASIDKVEGLVEEAARNGAELVAFPETFLSGYPWFIWLMAPANWARFMPQYHENSLALDSLEMARLQAIAAKSKVTLVMGFSERAGGTRYMAQSIIGPDGVAILHRRKLKPTHAERTVFGEGDGSDLQVVDSAFGRLGALNCWEHLQPLTKMAMYSQNEEVHVASWPSFCNCRDLVYAFGPEVNNAASRIYAVEGSCFVLAPSSTVSQEMFDMLCETPEQAHLLNTRTSGPGGGFSMIYGPDGRPLCEPLAEDVEGILYADLDPHQIIYAKSGADPIGHYSRPDTLSLNFDRRKKRIVHDIVPRQFEQTDAAEDRTPSEAANNA